MYITKHQNTLKRKCFLLKHTNRCFLLYFSVTTIILTSETKQPLIAYELLDFKKVHNQCVISNACWRFIKNITTLKNTMPFNTNNKTLTLKMLTNCSKISLNTRKLPQINNPRESVSNGHEFPHGLCVSAWWCVQEHCTFFWSSYYYRSCTA